MPDYINALKLEKHIEGGYFRRSYSSQQKIKHNQQERLAISCIYYLLKKDDYSAWHRLGADEIWHFYDGQSVVLIHSIDQSGNHRCQRLGRPEWQADFHIAIPGNTWFAAELEDKNQFALMGCSVAPGFEYQDFELANRQQILTEFPESKDLFR